MKISNKLTLNYSKYKSKWRKKIHKFIKKNPQSTKNNVNKREKTFSFVVFSWNGVRESEETSKIQSY